MEEVFKIEGGHQPVSYTHLDVYKRQRQSGFRKRMNKIVMR